MVPVETRLVKGYALTFSSSTSRIGGSANDQGSQNSADHYQPEPLYG
jgi:hypothetical protein